MAAPIDDDTVLDLADEGDDNNDNAAADADDERAEVKTDGELDLFDYDDASKREEALLDGENDDDAKD